MGTSTDAIICYGIQIGKDGDMPEIFCEDDRDFDDILIEAFGCPPQVEWADSGSQKDAWDKDWEARNKFKKELGLELVRHCYLDETMYCLAITKSIQTVHRGYPEEVEANTVVREYAWDKKLAEAIKVLKLEDATPKWWLQSYWG